MIFHITSQKDWQRAHQAGKYHAASLETEGFIHCSHANQVAWVANNFYRDVPDLVLLQIDPSKLTAELRYDEIATGDRFPHIYGVLNLDAVVQVLEFAPQIDGTFSEFEG